MATRDLIVLKLLKRLGAHAFRTDLMGTIRCVDLACTSEHPARQSKSNETWPSTTPFLSQYYPWMPSPPERPRHA
jgi:hypothetical protein